MRNLTTSLIPLWYILKRFSSDKSRRDFAERSYKIKEEEELTTSHTPYSTFWGDLDLVGLDMISPYSDTNKKYNIKTMQHEIK